MYLLKTIPSYYLKYVKTELHSNSSQVCNNFSIYTIADEYLINYQKQFHHSDLLKYHILLWHLLCRAALIRIKPNRLSCLILRPPPKGHFF